MRKLMLALALTFVAPAGAWAQDKDDKVKRDPKGVKGISPYREDLAKGREAFADGDHDGAMESFEAAIAKDGERNIGYLLKAQVQLSKGDLASATKTAETAQNKAGTEEDTAKVLFFVADLKERNAAPASTEEKKSKLSEALLSTWEKVKENWTTYASYLADHTRVPDYKASADERKKQVDARVKRERGLRRGCRARSQERSRSGQEEEVGASG